ncbi:hypothetical protein PS718_04905 [Pseudomonas fluorescens]|uniref:Uncharacterized protein n=1 Tax=Pseudomonas fluorescens TaxID=294 RepID=A0A5E7ET13_PSEFL|nr:hypothetical protein [Pseudomonas fluorescens]VVO30060.1 hypothetical protein PS718_04905 [Pseudomonas fluorescens]
MTDANVRSLLKEAKNSSGSFSAEVDQVPFLRGKKFLFLKVGEDYFIVGDDSGEHWVTFSVPASLEEDGPHTVKKYAGGLAWQVMIKKEVEDVLSGSATVTFENDRTRVKGEIDFVLVSGKKVTGKFDVWNV